MLPAMILTALAALIVSAARNRQRSTSSTWMRTLAVIGVFALPVVIACHMLRNMNLRSK